MTLSPVHTPPATVLVVDDHRKIRETLATILRRHDFDVLTAADASAMRAMMKHRRFDVVLLDAMLPDGDGFSMCQQLSQSDDAAIIMLTACSAVDERVRGLQLGADDYVVKPFEPSELVARIRTVLRRRSRVAPPAASRMPTSQAESTRHTYRFARLLFTPSDGRVVADTRTAVQLTSVESRLLVAFVTHPHVVLSRDRLIDLCARPGSDPFSRAIDRQVSRLRHKLSTLTQDASLLNTVWGDGYRLAADVDRVGE